MLGVLAGLGLAATPNHAATAGKSHGGIMTNSDENRAQPPGTARAKASASASASASSSAGRGAGGCQARSESSAEAQAGDQYMADHDRDEKTSADGACSAKAESKAEAGIGTRRN